MVSPLHAQPGSDSPLKMQQPEMLFGTGCMPLKGKCVCLESQKQHAPPSLHGSVAWEAAAGSCCTNLGKVLVGACCGLRETETCCVFVSPCLWLLPLLRRSSRLQSKLIEKQHSVIKFATCLRLNFLGL